MIVARDLAHAKIRARLEAGEPMPAYFKDHPVYYALVQAKTPEGYASGAFEPDHGGARMPLSISSRRWADLW